MSALAAACFGLARLLAADEAPPPSPPSDLCVFTAPSGGVYNITELASPALEFTIVDDTNNFTYYWNGCHGTQKHEGPDHETPGCKGPEDGPDEQDAACQLDEHELIDVYNGLGKLSQTTFLETRPGFIAVSYGGGSVPPSGPPPRKLTAEIECDRGATTPSFDIHTPAQGHAYNLRVRSVHGCVVGKRTQ